MPNTWKAYSLEILGYIAPQTEINEEYVAAMKVERWLRDNRSVNMIALAWNAGPNAIRCSKGINALNVQYDSCAYVKEVLHNYHNQ